MRRVVCVTARAFISPRNKCGGNPVNIFLVSGPTTSDERTKLARTCSWESIVIENESEHKIGTLPTFHFYMPSGDEVSFCCHAAIGACSLLSKKKMIVSAEDNLQSSLLSSSLTTVSFLTAEERLRYDATVTGNEVQLFTDTRHYESEFNSQPFSLEDLLSEMGLAINDVHSEIDSDISWPTFINTSIARPKTIIPIASLERLHAATPPKNPEKFRKMCDSIDSTGVYLYSTFTKREIIEALAEERELAFECRQFPRSSGYSEDPATGIAAGALASSLHKRKIMRYKSESWGSGSYDIFQGTAMGRPSKIHVRIGESEETNSYPSLKVTYTGVVAFDAVAFSDLAIET